MGEDGTVESKPVTRCPFCGGSEIIRKGTRKKKLETVQLWYCHRCRRKFTPLLTRGRTFPVNVILASLTLYNRLYTLTEAAKRVSDHYGLAVSPQNIANWLKSFAEYLPFLRLRPFVEKHYDRRKIFVETKLFHSQIYDFSYHRAKTNLILEEEFRHTKFRPLQEFLELVVAECPHEVFRESQLRASEYREIFNVDTVKIVPKENAAVRAARLVTQAVGNNALRHKAIEQFFLVNDSVTVAVEVPVLLTADDLLHYQTMLGFRVPMHLADREFITGHIDIVQVRNGSIHILDYKPSAAKEKCVDQLTIYALALSRLTGIRLFHFKCAWFDEEHSFEFFPLHVVYKKKKRERRKERPND